MTEYADLTELLQGQRLSVLATNQDGRPYTNLVAFVVTPDLKELIFATNRETRKYANLMANPQVALLVDNRSNRETDFGTATAVTILGQAEEVPAAALADYHRLYLTKHPYLEGFVTAPTCALIRVRVEKFILVSKFQEVKEITPAP